MRFLAILSRSATGLALCVAGCGTSALDDADEQGLAAQSASKPVDPDDPFGACVLEQARLEEFLPDYFAPEFGQCTQPDPEVTLGACFGWAGPTELCTYRYWTYCTHFCHTDADCPSPKTGNAKVACGGAVCELPCNKNTICPDGFTCADPADRGISGTGVRPLCVQYIELEVPPPCTIHPSLLAEQP
jgi:hypothetical protein